MDKNIWTGLVCRSLRAPPSPRWFVWSKLPPGYEPDAVEKRQLAEGTTMRLPWPLDAEGRPLDWAFVDIAFDHKTGRPAALEPKRPEPAAGFPQAILGE